MAAGRAAEAFREIQLARQRDPLSVPVNSDLGFHHYYAGQYDQAISTFKELSMRKDGPLPVDGILMQLGRTYLVAGKRADAQQTFLELLLDECDRWATTLLFVSHNRQLASYFDREVNLPAINQAQPVAVDS